MVEVKIQTHALTYRFEEEGSVDELTVYFNSLLRDEEDYVDEDDNKSVIIPYSVLNKSIITVNNLNECYE